MDEDELRCRFVFGDFNNCWLDFVLGADGEHLDVCEMNGFESDTLKKMINLFFS